MLIPLRGFSAQRTYCLGLMLPAADISTHTAAAAGRNRAAIGGGSARSYPGRAQSDLTIDMSLIEWDNSNKGATIAGVEAGRGKAQSG